MFDFSTGGLFTNKMVLLLPLGSTSYWFISIFYFLFKRSLYGKFTSVIQRFWKRTLYLFWGLELFLFFIYLFLALNCASEVEWMFDQPQLYKSQYFSYYGFLMSSLVVLWPIMLITYLQQSVINKTSTHVNVLFLSILFVVSYSLLEEFYQVYLVSTMYTNSTLVFNKDKLIWQWSDSSIKRRTLQHFYFLLVVLKFWHVFFIYAMLYLSVTYYSTTGELFQGSLAANKQNLLFLFGFNMVMCFSIFKFYMNYCYMDAYSPMMVNNFLKTPGNLSVLVKAVL